MGVGESKEKCGRWDCDWMGSGGGGVFDSWVSGVV